MQHDSACRQAQKLPRSRAPLWCTPQHRIPTRETSVTMPRISRATASRCAELLPLQLHLQPRESPPFPSVRSWQTGHRQTGPGPPWSGTCSGAKRPGPGQCGSCQRSRAMVTRSSGRFRRQCSLAGRGCSHGLVKVGWRARSWLGGAYSMSMLPNRSSRRKKKGRRQGTDQPAAGGTNNAASRASRVPWALPSAWCARSSDRAHRGAPQWCCCPVDTCACARGAQRPPPAVA